MRVFQLLFGFRIGMAHLKKLANFFKFVVHNPS